MNPNTAWNARPCSLEAAQAFACHQPFGDTGPIDTVPQAIKEAEPAQTVNFGQKYLADLELLTTPQATDLSLLFTLIVVAGLMGFMCVRLTSFGHNTPKTRAFLGAGAGLLILLLWGAVASFAWLGGFGLLLTICLLALGGAAYLALYELLQRQMKV